MKISVNFCLYVEDIQMLDWATALAVEFARALLAALQSVVH